MRATETQINQPANETEEAVTPVKPDGSLYVLNEMPAPFGTAPATLFNYYPFTFGEINYHSSQYWLYVIQQAQQCLQQHSELVVVEPSQLITRFVSPAALVLGDTSTMNYSCLGTLQPILDGINKGELKQLTPYQTQDLMTAMIHYRAVFVLQCELEIDMRTRRIQMSIDDPSDVANTRPKAEDLFRKQRGLFPNDACYPC
jgi:hypothetical protein